MTIRKLKFPKRLTWWQYLIIIAIIGFTIVKFGFDKEENTDQLTTEVFYGEFTSMVKCSGELEAERSVSIDVPTSLTSGRARIYDIKVTDIVEEGTQVDSGEYVASLDHSAVMTQLTTVNEALKTALESLEDAKMDTGLSMTNLRNDLLSDFDNVEEKRIVLEQSLFESPAIQRKAEMDLDRAKRSLEQNQRNYKLQLRKSIQKIESLQTDIKRKNEEIDEYNSIFQSLYIKAPQNGIVIYKRDYSGNKIQTGSMVSRWRPEIAELPDLTSLISRNFVNEIDISNVKIGQKAEIGIDAFPDKKFMGEVMKVSNIGQTLPGKNTKVFEVQVRVVGSDSLLKPSMTTNCVIHTGSFPNVTYIALDALIKTDTLQYVLLKKEKVKRIVRPTVENENYIIIAEGVTKGDQLLYNSDANTETWSYDNLKLYETMKAERDTLKSEK